MWVRGLKHLCLYVLKYPYMSHPLWVRGLKQQNGYPYSVRMTSHPLWVRGLKPVFHQEFENITGRTLCGCVD